MKAKRKWTGMPPTKCFKKPVNSKPLKWNERQNYEKKTEIDYSVRKLFPLREQIIQDQRDGLSCEEIALKYDHTVEDVFYYLQRYV